MNTVRTSAPPYLSRLTLVAAGMLFSAGFIGCKSNSAPAPIITNNAAADANGPDPADANMAGSSGQGTQVMGQSQSYTPQQQGQSYAAQQAPAPIVQGYNNNASSNEAYSNAQNFSGQNNGAQPGYDKGYSDGEAAEAATAPPPLPVYDQPPAPDPNDIWTPGYWNYAPTGYYWVPGTWVAAPYYGALWTPPYWGYAGNRYRFHRGYWGPHIGYYGGINYGFGYIGVGYYGGYWRGHDFYYNRSVNRVGSNFRTVYERPVIVNNVRYDIHPTVYTSYNGGPGGIHAEPRPFEVAAERERHEGPLPAQLALRQAAASNRGNFFAQNQGRPAQVAFAHPPNGPAALPANNPAQSFNRPGGPEEHNGFNRPAAPAGANQPFNRPNASAEPNQPINRAGAPATEPGFHGNAPRGPEHGIENRPAPVGNPGLNANHQGSPIQPQGQPGTPGGAAAGHRPFEPGNRSGGFENPNGSRRAPEAAPLVNHAETPRPEPSQPRINQPGGNPGFNRPTQPSTPRVDTPRPVAPAPHVEAPRPAPAPHMEAPRPAAAPRVETPHGPPAGGGGAHPGGGGRPEGGGHPGPR